MYVTHQWKSSLPPNFRRAGGKPLTMSYVQTTSEHLKISQLSLLLHRDRSERTADFCSYSTKWIIPQKMAWRRNSGKLCSTAYAFMHISPSGSCECAAITARAFQLRIHHTHTHGSWPHYKASGWTELILDAQMFGKGRMRLIRHVPHTFTHREAKQSVVWL